jgi:SAM-dependent methyltransferase
VIPMHDGAPNEAPSAWVVRQARHLRPGAQVLDLACGSGRHVRWLAAQGFPVLAVDRDGAALAGLAGLAGIEVRQADLEADPWPLPDQCFAGIVVTRYLHRPLLPTLASSLAPGGVLVYETFMQGNEAWGRPSRPEFLLAPGELSRFAAEQGLQALDFQEGFQAEPRPAVLQAICCRRPE